MPKINKRWRNKALLLVVDDNKGILAAVQLLLGTCFEKVITLSTLNKIKNVLHDEEVDIVLLDMNSVPVSIAATRGFIGSRRSRR